MAKFSKVVIEKKNVHFSEIYEIVIDIIREKGDDKSSALDGNFAGTFTKFGVRGKIDLGKYGITGNIFVSDNNKYSAEYDSLGITGAVVTFKVSDRDGQKNFLKDIMKQVKKELRNTVNMYMLDDESSEKFKKM